MQKEEKTIRTVSRNTIFARVFLASFLFTSLLFSFEWVNTLEWKLTDTWTRHNYPGDVSEKVAVIGMNDDLFAIHDYDWPLEKDVYAELILYLQTMGAKVIAFDIEFSHNFARCGTSDTLFRQLVSISPEVVIGYGFIVQDTANNKLAETSSATQLREEVLSDGVYSWIDDRFAVDRGKIDLGRYEIKGALVPYDSLEKDMQRCGFFNRSIQMVDGIDRWLPLMMEHDSLIFSSLALSAVQQYYGENASFVPHTKEVVLGDHRWSVTKSTDMAVNFSDSIPIYKMSDVMLSFKDFLMGIEPEIGQEELDGRVIFIGYAAQSDGDLGKNPVSVKTNETGQTPMVMLHAYSANTLLNDRELTVIERPATLISSLALLLLLLILFLTIENKKILYTIIPSLLIAFFVMGFFLYKHYILFPVVEPLFSTGLFTIIGVFINYYDNNREYRYINQLFRTYISPDVIAEMARTHTIPKLGGEEIIGTAFFTDIEKFSTFSEMFTPEELIHVLNEYFSDMTTILKNNRGTLDKFIGDAIVAMFGAPYYSDENPIHACQTAYEMQNALALLREKWSKDPILGDKVGNMQMRIGINSGAFVVGNLGSEDRMSYTMMGDTVNLAARLESGAKQYGVYTMVGESTYKKAKDHFLFRNLDRIVVVGKSEPVSVYELIAPIDDADDTQKRITTQYEMALAIYFKGEFETALNLFKETAMFELLKGNKTPSLVMIERCKELLQEPPQEWNGVYTMRSK